MYPRGGLTCNRNILSLQLQKKWKCAQCTRIRLAYKISFYLPSCVLWMVLNVRPLCSIYLAKFLVNVSSENVCIVEVSRIKKKKTDKLTMHRLSKLINNYRMMEKQLNGNHCKLFNSNSQLTQLTHSVSSNQQIHCSSITELTCVQLCFRNCPRS